MVSAEYFRRWKWLYLRQTSFYCLLPCFTFLFRKFHHHKASECSMNNKGSLGVILKCPRKHAGPTGMCTVAKECFCRVLFLVKGSRVFLFTKRRNFNSCPQLLLKHQPNISTHNCQCGAVHSLLFQAASAFLQTQTYPSFTQPAAWTSQPEVRTL